jgi:hypothetical protein
MELPCCFFLLFNGDIKIFEGFIKVVELIVQQSPEKVEARLFLVFTAALDSNREKLQSLLQLLAFDAVVNVVST